jgi:2-polyprenyl-3-methyl-5-hydroxy-6-metoxy-1,4-benzoquinol methylase
MDLYLQILEINHRPAPFEHDSAEDLWTDEHTSCRMLDYHLDGSIDVASRNTQFLDRSAAWIVRRFGLTEGKSVADFGCGPGLYTMRLAASRADITGIDFSERSLRYARERAQEDGLAIEYIRTNYLDFETEKRFDLVTLIMCDYCALSPGQRRTLLDRLFAHLKPGGAALFDVYSLRAFDERQAQATYQAYPRGGFWSPASHFCFHSTFKYDAERVVLDKYTIVEEARVRVVYNWLQYFDADGLRGEIEERGFVVDELLGDLAGAAFDPAAHEFGIVAIRPR